MKAPIESRRQFVASATKFAAGSMVGIAGVQMASARPASAASFNWPWPYAPLDPDTVRVYAHDLFWAGKACSAGSFGGILKALQETVGAPFTEIPMEILLFGHGGAAGWGTLCGALNGPSAAISLVSEKAVADKLINELIGWYTQAELPTEKSNEFAVNRVFKDNRYDQALVSNVCGSALCHISVTEWCISAGKKVADLERKERCARIAGDGAAKAVELLNDQYNGVFAPHYVAPESIAECMSCHGSGFADNVAVKMECNQCHGTPHAGTSIQRTSMLPAGYALQQNYPNPFNAGTQLQFSIPESEQVSLRIYDVRGRLVRTLVDHEVTAPGTYEAHWDGTENSGIPAGTGTYLVKLKAGGYHHTVKVTLVK